MTEDEHAQVQAAIDTYLDGCAPDMSERFVDRLLHTAQRARPDQRLGEDPVLCMDCFRHLEHTNSKGTR